MLLLFVVDNMLALVGYEKRNFYYTFLHITFFLPSLHVHYSIIDVSIGAEPEEVAVRAGCHGKGWGIFRVFLVPFYLFYFF